MRRSRSLSERTHRHTDLRRDVDAKDEEFLFSLLRDRPSPLVLALDRVQDPHNLGACLRTADGAGADIVIAPKDQSVGLTDTVRTVACGAAESLPFAQVTNLVRCLQRLKKDANAWVVGAADDGDRSLYDLDLKGPLVIVLGAEGKGLRRLTRENCDFLARIPMRGSVECLNVSVAAGVCLYEAARQRQTGLDRSGGK